MNATDFLIAASSDDAAAWLGARLGVHGSRIGVYPLQALAHRIGETADAAQLDAIVDDLPSSLPPFAALVLMPALPSGASLHSSSAGIGHLLTACFALMKTALARFEDSGSQGRLFSVLPVDAVMGDPGDPVNSAVAGGMLSLFRTVAMELRRLPVTANTIVAPPWPADADAAAGAAAMLRALCAPDMQQVNGQEIYAAAAADVGRLHP